MPMYTTACSFCLSRISRRVVALPSYVLICLELLVNHRESL